MKAQKRGRVFAATALMTVMTISALTTASQAATSAAAAEKQAASASRPKMTLPQPAVVIQIGEALLEEYHGGNPAARTEIFRGGSAAQATPIRPAAPGKSRS